MSKQPRLPKASQPHGNHSSDCGSTSSVGYGRPPAHTRFKPGKSGNPKGRRKGQRNVRTVLAETLNQRITIRQGNRTRSVTKLDGVIITMVNGALKGEAKAQTSLITIMRSTGLVGEAPDATDSQPFTADDDAVLADYRRRQIPDLQQTKATDEQPALVKATSPNAELKS